MVTFKLVFGLKGGRCVQKEVAEPTSKTLIGKQIGETIQGDTIGFPGYELTITGGSDYCGFPMRKDVPGFARKKILAVKGIGMKKKAPGIRQKKTVCGNTIHPKIAQINVKVIKEGKEPLAQPTEEKKEEKKE
ncbi:30S ribosomal protein S6e [Candidatus Woesearchaeota archaeon]|nr:30S ribosomal protein S6e [Candidatus Woesearchaeota archaeon]